MKKNGFTLAEVLITLSIIGVVATMTLPALMTNVQEQQARTGIKKAINTMTEMAQMHEAIEGINYARLKGANSLEEINKYEDEDGNSVNPVNSFVGMMRDRGKLDIDKTLEGTADGAVKVETLAGLSLPDVIYFADGTALLFNATNIVSTDSNTELLDDGLPKGVVVVYDTNGAKGPNALSNCNGIVNGANDAVGELQQDGTYGDPTALTACNIKKNRAIADQFQIRLRGTVVQPEGAAATWAFNN